VKIYCFVRNCSTHYVRVANIALNAKLSLCPSCMEIYYLFAYFSFFRHGFLHLSAVFFIYASVTPPRRAVNSWTEVSQHARTVGKVLESSFHPRYVRGTVTRCTLPQCYISLSAQIPFTSLDLRPF